MIGRRLGLAACLFALGPAAALADCETPRFDGTPPVLEARAPVPPGDELRPVVPECLAGLTSANQENCSEAEIAAYKAAVDAYTEALNAYVAAADAHANAAVQFANGAVDYARNAQAHADAVFAFATCEAEALRGETR